MEPTGVRTYIVQFNKITGVITGIIQDLDISTLNQEFYNYAKVEMDYSTQDVQGTWDNWKVVNRAEQPSVMTEKQLNSLAEAKILKKYSTNRQLNIMAACLKVIGEKMELSELPEFVELKEMSEYIAEVRRSNTIRKQYYANSDGVEYISKEEEERRMQLAHEGGVHEFSGPRRRVPIKQAS